MIGKGTIYLLSRMMCVLFFTVVFNINVSASKAAESEKQLSSLIVSNLRVATWNLSNLADIGAQAQSGSIERTKTDFDRLEQYARQLDADIVALQEVASLPALHRIFQNSHYKLYLSQRAKVEKSGKHPGIYTAYAVRKSLAHYASVKPYKPLGLNKVHQGRLRWGLELILSLPNQKIYFLNVHLKSGCAFGSLEKIKKKACSIISRQVEPLKHWLDQRYVNNQTFMILGDFNRAFDRYSERDHFWQRLKDKSLSGSLSRKPLKQRNRCWEGTQYHYRYPVDFFVFDKKLLSVVDEKSYLQWDYEIEDREIRKKNRLPSDHCAASIMLNFDSVD